MKPSIAVGFCYLNAEKEIPRSLDPWYKHVDHFICEDGRFKTPLSPQMRKMKLSDYSTDNSEHLLKTRYPDKVIHERFLGTQMEKRQRCLDIAGELGCDYLIVWDSDDYIHPDYQDWDKFFKQLEALSLWDDQLFKMRAWIPSEELWSKQHNEVASNIWMKYVRIHKNPGQQYYVWNHFTFANKENPVEKVNQWMWDHPPVEPAIQGPTNPYILESDIVLDGIRITTDRTLRTKAQLSYGDGWSWQNMHDESYTQVTLPYVHHLGIKVYKESSDYFFDEKGRRRIYNSDGTVESIADPLVIKDSKVVAS